MKRNFLMFLTMLAVLSVVAIGCKQVEQAKEDLTAGLNTPLEMTVDPLTNKVTVEKAPADQAKEMTAIVSMIPYVGPFAPALTPLLVGFFAWRRGRKLRSKMPTSTNPITGAFGPKIGVGAVNLENTVQVVTDMFKGVYEVGADGSALKRGWKTALSTVLALVGGALLIPQVKDFVFDHSTIVAVIAFGSAFFSALEKKLQDVLPHVPAPTV